MNTPAPPPARSPKARSKAKKTLARSWQSLIVPSLVLFLSLFITFSLAQFLAQERDLARRQNFERTTTALTAEIRNKLNGYHQLLLQARGIAMVFDPVSARDWQRYTSSLSLAQNYPALLGLGLAELGQPSLNPSSAATASATPSPTPTDTASITSFDQAVTTPIHLIQPGANFDADDVVSTILELTQNVSDRSASQPNQPRVIVANPELTTTTDGQVLSLRYFTPNQNQQYQPPKQLLKAVAAELLTADTTNQLQLPHLVVIGGSDQPDAAALYLPVFTANGNQANNGSQTIGRNNTSTNFLMAPVNLDQALAGLVPNQHAITMTVSPQDTVVLTPPGNAADGANSGSQPTSLTQQDTIRLANGSWTISYLDRSPASWRDFTAPLTTVLGGAVSLLLFAVLFSLSSAKSLAQQLATNITSDLEATSAQDEALLASIADGIIATDTNQKITIINQAARDMLSLDSPHAINDVFHRVVTVLDEQLRPVSDETSFVAQVLDTHQPILTSRLLFAKSDGTSFPVRITASPITNAGNVDGVVMVFQDITEEKKIEAMKTEFINLASHQLRTPLSGIKWYLEMLINGEVGELSEEQLDIAKNINASNQRMIEMVKSLLQISRIESGKIVPEFEPTDLAEVVTEAQHNLQPLWQSKQAQLETRLDDVPAVETDRELVLEVIINILSNAIKYSPPESQVTIRLYRDNDQVVISVEDHGYGIPQEFQDKIFAKFFRGKNVQKHHPDGTGLGLYLVEMITKVLDGKVWFQSQEKEGSTFWFSLPISHSDAATPDVS